VLEPDDFDETKRSLAMMNREPPDAMLSGVGRDYTPHRKRVFDYAPVETPGDLRSPTFSFDGWRL